MSSLFCNQGVEENCETYIVLDFCRGLSVLGRNGNLSFYRNVSDMCREHSLVLCFGSIDRMYFNFEGCRENPKKHC